MNWTEVTIKTTTEAVEAISNILMEERCGGVMIEDPKDFLFQKKNELIGTMLKRKYSTKAVKMEYL